jgi:hypothetical protein
MEEMGDGDWARKRWTREEKEGEEGGCTARSGSGSWSGNNQLAGRDGLVGRDCVQHYLLKWKNNKNKC